jgi:hypothetical protein
MIVFKALKVIYKELTHLENLVVLIATGQGSVILIKLCGVWVGKI